MADALTPLQVVQDLLIDIGQLSALVDGAAALLEKAGDGGGHAPLALLAVATEKVDAIFADLDGVRGALEAAPR